MTTVRPSSLRPGRSGVAFDPARLDVARFGEAGATLSGEWQVAELPRLASAVVPSAGATSTPVRWSATGERARLAGAGECPVLRLVADAQVSLECQRCLEPLLEHLHVDRRFFHVEGEDAAAALDLESEEDVLALRRTTDLCELVEDELLLALPLIPRHETCLGVDTVNRVASPGGMPSGSDPSAPDHPFASLAVLRDRPKPQ